MCLVLAMVRYIGVSSSVYICCDDMVGRAVSADDLVESI